MPIVYLLLEFVALSMEIRIRASLFIWLLAGILINNPLYGQPGSSAYSLHQLDNRYGLSNSAVNCILQDSDGMLWVGTWDGLNRYDGQEFHVFNFRDLPHPKKRPLFFGHVVFANDHTIDVVPLTIYCGLADEHVSEAHLAIRRGNAELEKQLTAGKQV